MKVLAFVSQKGGAGKSTLAATIAALAASGNIKTAIIDLDQQASISAWHLNRSKSDITLFSTHPPLLITLVNQLREEGYGLAIIDTPPHNSTAAANSVLVADYTIVPVRPSSFDIVAAQATFDLLAQTSARCGVVINAIPPSTIVEEPAIEFVKSAGFEVLARIKQRIGFQHATTHGMGITEHEPNGKASHEAIALWNALQERIA